MELKVIQWVLTWQNQGGKLFISHHHSLQLVVYLCWNRKYCLTELSWLTNTPSNKIAQWRSKKENSRFTQAGKVFLEPFLRFQDHPFKQLHASTSYSAYSEVTFTSSLTKRVLTKTTSNLTHSSATEICSCPHGQAKCLLEKGFIWDMTNTEVSGHNHEKYVWRSKGDSVKTKNTDMNVKQGLLCCQWYWYIAQSGWNDDGGLPSHSSTSPQINSRWLKLGDSWMFQQDSDPKRTSELPTYAWRLSEIVTQNKTVFKFLYSYCIDDNA